MSTLYGFEFVHQTPNAFIGIQALWIFKNKKMILNSFRIKTHNLICTKMGSIYKQGDVYEMPYCYLLMLFLRAKSVLYKSIVTVIGPTPPGTGVMYDAFGATESKSTSPSR